MNRQRIALFLLGCLGSRIALAEGARRADPTTLQKFAPLAYIPAIGFMLIFTLGLRKTGIETFGEPIWWNNLRPVHALLFALFAYSASHRQANSYQILYADVMLGLVAWTFNQPKI